MWKRAKDCIRERRCRGVSARKYLLPGLVLLGSIMASYLVVSRWLAIPRASVDVAFDDSGASDTTPVDPFASVNGTHLIVYVIAASDCGWSTLPTVTEAIGDIRERLQSAHGASYAQISVIGVALDRDLGAGLRFLSDLGNGRPDGAFDQITVGGGWFNEQVVRLVWEEGVAQAASPQVIVIERSVNTETYPLTSTIEIQDDKLLANPVGGTELIQWIDDGLPLDQTAYGERPAR